MKQPAMVWEGDSLKVSYEDEGVTLTFSRMREERDGLSAEVEIKHLDRYVWFGNLNLSSGQTRDRLASSLVKKSKATDWEIAIPQTCHKVIVEWRKPAPIVNLAEVEPEMAPSYLVRPILPKGETTLLFADGAAGKSMLALWLAVGVSWQLELPSNLRVTEKGKVLYLDWETHSEAIARRLKRISEGFKVAPPQILYREMLAPLSAGVSHIKADCQEHDISLIVIDSLGAACSGDINESAVAIPTMNALRALPGTKLVVHHITHEGARSNGRTHATGSRYFTNLARSGWELRRGEEDSEDDDTIPLALFHTKVNEGKQWRWPIGLSMSFEGEEGPITVTRSDPESDPSLVKRLGLRQRITVALKSGKRETKELAEELDVTEPTLRRTLNRMKNVVRLEEGGGRGVQTVWGLQEEIL